MSREYTIQLMKLSDGKGDPHEGQWLLNFDPGPQGSRGVTTATQKQADAKRFPNHGAAWQFWIQENGCRADGKPNRPLTVWSVVIEPLEEDLDDKLSMWTVYDHPKDFPESYVARRSEVTAQGQTHTSDLMVSSDLVALREALEKLGLCRITRLPDDDACIVEVWL